MKINYLEQLDKIPLAYLPNEKNGRTFEVYEAIDIILSDGRLITIEKGYKTDLSSVPSWAWSIFKPMDSGLLGDLIHDWLWSNKVQEIEWFDGDIHRARRFADMERLKWRKALASDKKFKNAVTHYIIRAVGGLFYSRQIDIPG